MLIYEIKKSENDYINYLINQKYQKIARGNLIYYHTVCLKTMQKLVSQANELENNSQEVKELDSRQWIIMQHRNQIWRAKIQETRRNRFSIITKERQINQPADQEDITFQHFSQNQLAKASLQEEIQEKLDDNWELINAKFVRRDKLETPVKGNQDQQVLNGLNECRASNTNQEPSETEEPQQFERLVITRSVKKDSVIRVEELIDQPSLLAVQEPGSVVRSRYFNNLTVIDSQEEKTSLISEFEQAPRSILQMLPDEHNNQLKISVSKAQINEQAFKQMVSSPQQTPVKNMTPKKQSTKKSVKKSAKKSAQKEKENNNEVAKISLQKEVVKIEIVSTPSILVLEKRGKSSVADKEEDTQSQQGKHTPKEECQQEDQPAQQDQQNGQLCSSSQNNQQETNQETNELSQANKIIIQQETNIEGTPQRKTQQESCQNQNSQLKNRLSGAKFQSAQSQKSQKSQLSQRLQNSEQQFKASIQRLNFPKETESSPFLLKEEIDRVLALTDHSKYFDGPLSANKLSVSYKGDFLEKDIGSLVSQEETGLGQEEISIVQSKNQYFTLQILDSQVYFEFGDYQNGICALQAHDCTDFQEAYALLQTQLQKCLDQGFISKPKKLVYIIKPSLVKHVKEFQPNFYFDHYQKHKVQFSQGNMFRKPGFMSEKVRKFSKSHIKQEENSEQLGQLRQQSELLKDSIKEEDNELDLQPKVQRAFISEPSKVSSNEQEIKEVTPFEIQTQQDQGQQEAQVPEQEQEQDCKSQQGNEEEGVLICELAQQTEEVVYESDKKRETDSMFKVQILAEKQKQENDQENKTLEEDQLKDTKQEETVTLSLNLSQKMGGSSKQSVQVSPIKEQDVQQTEQQQEQEVTVDLPNKQEKQQHDAEDQQEDQQIEQQEQNLTEDQQVKQQEPVIPEEPEELIQSIECELDHSLLHQIYDAQSHSHPAFDKQNKAKFEEFDAISPLISPEKLQDQSDGQYQSSQPLNPTFPLGFPLQGFIQLMLCENWSGTNQSQNPTNWFISEKLDGIRCLWSGKQFYLRTGTIISPPESFRKDFPNSPLDGELYLGPGTYPLLSKLVKGEVEKIDSDKLWSKVQFVVCDAPALNFNFKQRLIEMQKTFQNIESKNLRLINYKICKGRDHVQLELKKVLLKKGEGLVLKSPNSLYERKRSWGSLKVKECFDSEGLVQEVVMGPEGKFSRMLVEVQGKIISLKNACNKGHLEGQKLPKVGQEVSFKFLKYDEKGVPVNPVFWRIKQL